MTRTEKENLVPVWERITISLEAAAAYSGIGVRKLIYMTDYPISNMSLLRMFMSFGAN